MECITLTEHAYLNENENERKKGKRKNEIKI